MRHLVTYWADTITQWFLDLLDAWFPAPADDLMALVTATAEPCPLRLVVRTPTLVLVDHSRCEGGDGCARVICDCPTEVPCRNTVSRGCLHHRNLCDECRPNCDDCRDDAAYDAGRW